MSISATNLWQLYANQYYSGVSGTPALQATSATNSQTTSATGSVQGVSGSSGDSFQLSGSQPMSAGLYGPPPPMPLDNSGSSTSSSGTTSSSSTSSSTDTLMKDIKSFLAKAADGTATDSDLTSLESELQAAGVMSTGSNTVSSTSSTGDSSTVTGTGLSSGSGSGSGNIMNDIKSFLAKAADGTATDSDLTALESELQSAKQTAPQPPPFSSGSSTSSSTSSSDSDTLLKEIQSFLAKVADGSVTDSDLATLKSELQGTTSTTSTSQV